MDKSILEKNKLIIKRSKRSKKKIHKKGEYECESINITNKDEQIIINIADSISETVNDILHYGERLDKLRQQLKHA